MTENNQDNGPSVFDNPAVVEDKKTLFNEDALILAYQVTIGDFSTWFDREDVFEPNGNGNDFRIRITKFGSKAPSGGVKGKLIGIMFPEGWIYIKLSDPV